MRCFMDFNAKKNSAAGTLACAALALMMFAACSEDSSSTKADDSEYTYTSDNAIETAVFQYAADSLCQKSDSTISIPFTHILGKDDSKSDDIRVWAYIWNSEYSAKGDTLFMQSGADNSGVLHLKKEGDSYVVKSIEIPDEANYAEESKKLFADYYDEYEDIHYNQFKSTPLRTKIIADFVKQNGLNFTMYQDYGYDAILLFPDETGKPVEHASSEIAAIYAATIDNYSILYFYKDNTFRQYVVDNGKISPFAEGGYYGDVEGNSEKSTDIEINVKKFYDEDGSLNDVRITYLIDKSSKESFRLYPIKENKDMDIVAAFMQADKQKLVKTDGSEEMLTTMWFYYDDGTFEQYALVDSENNVLFSSGDYSTTDGFVSKESVLTIHRTKKYQDGKGLADYESEHDYVIGDLEFIRVYPEK